MLVSVPEGSGGVQEEGLRSDVLALEKLDPL